MDSIENGGNELQGTSTPEGFSYFRDVYVPIGIAIAPATLFFLMGRVTAGFGKPGAQMPGWAVVSMVVFQTAGIVAMALVILIRLESGMRQLTQLSGGRANLWRRLCFFGSMLFLAFFDILINVAAGVSAPPLMVLAIPMFVIYFIGIRVTFAGLRTPVAVKVEALPDAEAQGW